LFYPKGVKLEFEELAASECVGCVGKRVHTWHRVGSISQLGTLTLNSVVGKFDEGEKRELHDWVRDIYVVKVFAGTS